MKSTSDDIRQWLHKQPDWLQDAAERLLKQGSLSATDVKDLVARLKIADGQKVTVHRAFDSLAQPSAAGLDLRLKSIDALTGIEGLAPRRPLIFGNTNLTVLYGHNGSGKSSYTRLLKKVTGKSRALDLKSNVFQAVPTQRKCRFTYELAGVDISNEWLANAAPVEALRAVDIFDADEAVHYLSSENAAAYTPPIVALFENLALACDQVKAQLQDEQSKLVKALPAIPHDYATTAVPLYGKKPEAALKDLVNARVPQARNALQEHGTVAYYPLGKSICSDFRILLERMVEFVLLADVVQRHRRAVNTLGKIQNLVKITTTDCALIEELMTKYSSYEHSQSSEAPVELPEPDELKVDIERLIAWNSEFSKRSI